MLRNGLTNSRSCWFLKPRSGFNLKVCYDFDNLVFNGITDGWQLVEEGDPDYVGCKEFVFILVNPLDVPVEDVKIEVSIVDDEIVIYEMEIDVPDCENHPVLMHSTGIIIAIGVFFFLALFGGLMLCAIGSSPALDAMKLQ